MPITMKTPRKVGGLAPRKRLGFHDLDLAELKATRDLGRAGHEKDALALAAQQTSLAVKAQTLLGVIVGKTKAELPEQEQPR
jgi:hypothetical protein